MRVIFVEGPDRCGKTEISKALSAETGLPYFKVSTEKENWKNNSFSKSLPFDALLPQFVRQTDTSFISDRCYASEYVYSKVFGRKTDWDALSDIDEEWSGMGAIYVILFRHNYNDVSDELVKKDEDFYKLSKRYVDFIDFTDCSVITMHVDDFDDDINLQLPLLSRTISYVASIGHKVRVDL